MKTWILSNRCVGIRGELVNAIDAARVDAWIFRGWNDPRVFRQIDALRRFFRRHALLPKRLSLLIEVPPVRLQIADVIFAFEHAAVSWQYRVELQRHDRLERRRPLLYESVSCI